MKKIICCIAAILIISLQSCLSVIANKYEINSKSPKLEKIDVQGKEVYFLGMSHLAKKEFYDNTKLLIEDFQAKGFIFYLESINDFDNKIIILDTLAVKKFRKLTDLDLSIKYSKSQNPYLQKLKNRYALIDQPKYQFFGLKNYKRVDYLYTQMIDFYELKYKRVILDTCDIKTPLGNIYKCETTQNSERKIFTNEIIFDKRNKLIAESLVNSSDKKIIIIYGKMHLKGIREYLKK